MPAVDPKPVIDTSKMSPAQREALELTESAREAVQVEPGFAGGLFMGRFNLAGIHPFPTQSAEDRDHGAPFLEQLEAFLKEHVNPDEIDRTGEIPQNVIEALARLGAFSIKISPEFGGLGLSQTNYCRAGMMLGSFCGNLTALLSAHQSIGVPQPLILFGTDEQKRRFLPRVARGEISAFALTEIKVGSDPAKMETQAEPTPDGEAFILNGEKLWCTNGVKAGVIVVMEKPPQKMVHGKPKNQITAFVLDMDTPGVEVAHRCRFMGLKALYNGVIRFTNVRVPRENILLAEGRGLRVALTTLNTGRLTLPAACVGLSKRCLAVAREWATERTWEIVNDTMQIRGGRGYETAQSLAARGEEPVPVERFLRDCRINLIFEGSSEIMRLFIAREALDPHLKVGGPILNSQLPMSERVKSAIQAAGFYANWYPRQWLSSFGVVSSDGFHPVLAQHMRFAANASPRLARHLFHAIAGHGPKLERKQVLLGRFVDIGTEIFAIATSCARAQSMLRADEQAKSELLALADYFCRTARLRIDRLFSASDII